MVVRISYALWERTHSGYQWTWRAADLKDSLLDDFYYRIEKPEDASTIRPEDLCGGITKFAQVHGTTVDQYIVFYRFFDGGKEEDGRGRMTMLSAWTNAQQFPETSAACGLLDLFQNPTFSYVSERARTIGIEQPFNLILDESLPMKDGPDHQALLEFLHGIDDADHDYSLTIRNENYTIQKTVSVVLKVREAEAFKRRQIVEVEQVKASQLKREAEDLKLRVGEPAQVSRSAKEQKHKEDRSGTEQRRKKRKSTVPVILFLILSLILVVISVRSSETLTRLGNALFPPKLPTVQQQVVDQPRHLPPSRQGGEAVEALAQHIVDQFRHLPLHEQKKILPVLRSIVDEKNATRPSHSSRDILRVPNSQGVSSRPVSEGREQDPPDESLYPDPHAKR